MNYWFRNCLTLSLTKWFSPGPYAGTLLLYAQVRYAGTLLLYTKVRYAGTLLLYAQVRYSGTLLLYAHVSSEKYSTFFGGVLLLLMTILITSSPIGAWKCNFPAFRVNVGRPTNQPTNWPSEGHEDSQGISYSSNNWEFHALCRINW